MRFTCDKCGLELDTLQVTRQAERLKVCEKTDCTGPFTVKIAGAEAETRPEDDSKVRKAGG